MTKRSKRRTVRDVDPNVWLWALAVGTGYQIYVLVTAKSSEKVTADILLGAWLALTLAVFLYTRRRINRLTSAGAGRKQAEGVRHKVQLEGPMSNMDRLPERMNEPPERESRCPIHNRPMKWTGPGLFHCKACGMTWSEAVLKWTQTSN